MRRDKDMARGLAEPRPRAYRPGADTLQEGLERIAGVVGFRRPSSAIHPDNERRRLNELRYRPAGEPQRDAGQRTPHTAEGRAAVEVLELPLPVSSAAFNIRRLEKLVVQRFHLDRDSDGRTVFPKVQRNTTPGVVGGGTAA